MENNVDQKVYGFIWVTTAVLFWNDWIKAEVRIANTEHRFEHWTSRIWSRNPDCLIETIFVQSSLTWRWDVGFMSNILIVLGNGMSIWCCYETCIHSEQVSGYELQSLDSLSLSGVNVRNGNGKLSGTSAQHFTHRFRALCKLSSCRHAT